MKLKRWLQERYERMLEDFKELLSVREPLPSIRLNTLKVNAQELLIQLKARGWVVEPMQWYEHGYWVKEPSEVGNTIEHKLGYVYAQEASSMLPPLVLNPELDSTVLDLCAAPGSKTTQLAQLMQNSGAIVANDVNSKRIKALCSNLQRCGVMNTLVTQMDGRKFAQLNYSFDYVMVDAPCTASGTFRWSPKVLQQLSLDTIRRCSQLQRALLLAGFDCLKAGGKLVYSTCSLEPEENEAVVNWLLSKREAKLLRVKINRFKTRKGLTEWQGLSFDPSLKRCARVYPQDNGTDGFFLALLKREAT